MYRGETLRPLGGAALTVEQRFASKVRKEDGDGCWIWTGAIGSGGYGSLFIDGRWCAAHRRSYEIHNGPVPDGLMVIHACDRRACVRPSHLSLGTQTDNMEDMARKGRGAVGERHGMARLNPSDIVDIRSLHAFGATSRDLAAAFGVGRAQISRIVTRQKWAHVP